MPAITLDSYNTAIQDTYVLPSQPTAPKGNEIVVEATTSEDEIYIKFDFGLIPNDVVITSATLNLTSYNNYGDVDVNLHDVLSPWEEATVTWNTKPVKEFVSTHSLKSLLDGTKVSIPVTSLVQRMVKAGEAKHGFCLTGTGNKRIGFYSSETPTADKRPKLEVTYSIPETGKKQVEQVVSAIYATAAVDPHVVNIPAGIQAGDTLVASFSAVPGATIITPEGWQLLHEEVLAGNTKLLTYTKIADGTERSVSFKRTPSGTFDASAIINAYRNVKRITKIGTKQIANASGRWEMALSNIPANSLVAISASTGNIYNMRQWAPGFSGQKTSNTNQSTNIISTYNHEKTAYSTAEAYIDFSYSCYGVMQAIAIEPVANTAPNTPPTNNPKGTAGIPAILSVSTPKLDWSFSDSDVGDTQSKYQVRIKKASDNSIVHDTGVVTSAVTDYDVPAGVVQKNTLYFWEVQVYDKEGVPSSWSSPEYFKLTDQAAPGDAFTFNYTGAPQQFTVPGNATKIKVELWGAQGGDAPAGTYMGAKASGDLVVTPGEVLRVYVGGKPTANYIGGWNGGGKGAVDKPYGGGGATDIRRGGSALENRLAVAGGGAGASPYNRSDMFGHGGAPNGVEGAGYNNGSISFAGGKGATLTAGGAGGLVSGSSSDVPSIANHGKEGTLGQGGDSGAPTSGGYYGTGGGGGYYGGGGGADSNNYGGAGGGGGSSYVGGLLNGTMTSKARNGNGLAVITVLETSSPPTVTSRAPGSTDQTNPAGSSAAPLFSWDYSGAFTQAKYQIKIFNAQGTLAHDTGLIESSAKQHQMAEGVLTAGEVYGWELTVTDSKNVSYPTGRLYIITNRPPGGLTPISPEDRRRTTLLPVFEATIGDDVENDPQHFIIQLAENSDFTAGLIERKTSTDVTGWEVKESNGGYVTFPAEGADASFEFGSVKYSLQTPLTEGKTYYWRIAGMDAVTGARGNWSEVRRIRAGDKIDFSLRYPVKTSAAIQRLLIRAQYTLATDGENPAKVRFEACNNAFDENPVWEDVTKAIQSGDYYKFANTEKTADDWGFNIRALFEANDSLDPIEFYGFGISFD
ncbi:DNRLRE domain-containing protein [Bacillus badius]|uniref:receptor protein-tyrosine kinase n=1 Tax=Bacillus badius TaxID=1455 RepID=A0ABR5B1A1_BACBA|nr:DNRLRE domain-containing protein [Bacillus badius]KIL80744.1 hypothetical protein SD77_0592 [Bacillus badius]MED4715327.1 DNRLRE domain-containing protein [Bacillus badius]